MRSYKFLVFLFKIFLPKIFPLREAKNVNEKEIFDHVWSSTWEKLGFIDKRWKALKKYKKNDDVSTDIIVSFLGKIPIGTIRLQWDRQPTLTDFEVQQIWHGKVVEFTLFTVKKKWRCFGIPSLLLMKEGYRQAVERKTEGIVMITEDWLFKFLSKKLLFPFKKVSSYKEYEGGLCFVSFMSLKEVQKVLPERYPELVDFFTF